MPRGFLLDVRAGEGALSVVAAELGFAVTAADLDTTQFRPKLVCGQLALNQTLPFALHSFNIVLCVEGIEHIENPYALLREFPSVLTPGGRILLTTPNVLSLTSRVRQLTSGLQSYFNFWELAHYGHIMPASLPLLLTALERASFNFDALQGTRVKRSAQLLSPLAPLIQLITRRTVRADLAARLVSNAASFGEILVVIARAGGGQV